MKFFVFLLLASCAFHGPSGHPRQVKTVYSYTDISGNYRQSRESKKIDAKVISRVQIFDRTNNKVLEKSITVSKIGSVQGKSGRLLVVRPEASEFVVWLEGKMYSSKMRINSRKKVMEVSLAGPETKWQGTSEVRFPKGQFFCFFSQVPECLYHSQLLARAYQDAGRKIDFHVVWDSYPFVQDQLSNVGRNLFAPASIKFDGEHKNVFRYTVDVEGQLIMFHFSKNFDLNKMAWITQGITIVPPGEELANDVDE